MIVRMLASSTIWQAALIALEVFVVAIAGISVVKLKHGAPPTREGNPTETEAQRGVNRDKSSNNDQHAANVTSTNDEQTPSGKMNEGANDDKGQKEENDAAIAKYTFWLMWFTGILAISTILLFVATGGLWYYAGDQAEISRNQLKEMAAARQSGDRVAANNLRIMQGQLDEMTATREADRPWIFIKSVSNDPVVHEKNAWYSINLRFRLRNYGKSPAIIISVTPHMFWSAGFKDNSNPIAFPTSPPRYEPDPESESARGWRESGSPGYLTDFENKIVFGGGPVDRRLANEPLAPGGDGLIIIEGAGETGDLNGTFSFRRPMIPEDDSGMAIASTAKIWFYCVVTYRRPQGAEGVTSFYAEIQGGLTAAEPGGGHGKKYNYWK